MNKGNLSLFTNPLRSLRVHTLQQEAQQWMQQAEQQQQMFQQQAQQQQSFQQMVQESMNTYMQMFNVPHSYLQEGLRLAQEEISDIMRKSQRRSTGQSSS